MTPNLPQALDFAEEVRTLAALLDGLDAVQWQRPTQFKAWTAEDILRHLLCWDEAADWAVHKPDAFAARLARAREHGMRAVEAQVAPWAGAELLARWREHGLAMALRWQALDPRQRAPWVGPPMSVRSSITARQMEAWAHGQALFDMMGRDRPESARLRNIANLGVQTFGWSHQLRDWPVPAQMPRVCLRAPDGSVWDFGGHDEAGSVRGAAVGFCQVVTQTRHVDDTDLAVEGEVAGRWMQNAQCFAGKPEPPPLPGQRFRGARPPGLTGS